MKTEDLVNILSTNLDAVDYRGVSRRLLGAAGFGALAALVLMMLTLGPRPDLSDARAIAFLAMKFAFAGTVIAFSLVYLVKIARPSGERHVSLVGMVLPFGAALVAFGASLISAPPLDWWTLVFGQHWLLCIACIPIFAILPFAAIIFAMRQFASPTNLAWAGAVAGRAASGISAFVYALHCTDDSIAFVALWYGLTIALCTVIGGILGPRLLRW
jgi:hypothetical protein